MIPTIETELLILHPFVPYEAVNEIYDSARVQNPVSGRVMEKCGLTFSGYGSYKNVDGICKFESKVYRVVVEELPY